MTEEVREALMRLSMCAKGDCAICKYASDIGCSVEEQIAMVTDNARIIADALDRLEEEKHGRWESVGQDVQFLNKCSECESLVAGTGWEYCPNCGARMEGAEE